MIFPIRKLLCLLLAVSMTSAAETRRADIIPAPAVHTTLPALTETPPDLLRLVNRNNPAGAISVNSAQVEGIDVDARIAAPLREMLAAVREEGLPAFLCAGLRDSELQLYVFRRALALGSSIDEANAAVGAPGFSDYETGLSVDITDCYHELKTPDLADTETLRYLAEHCAEFGFILRYPPGCEEHTGMNYAPWHFRYVGVDAARTITDAGICLEEYTESYMKSD